MMLRRGKGHINRLGAGIRGLVLALFIQASPGDAQDLGPEKQRALSVTHAALQAISDEDVIALTDLMVDDAIMFALPADGGSPNVTTRDQARARPMTGDFVERGFDGEVSLTGGLASVWLPYDFYRDGEWSHCGVDTFTLVRVDGEWLVASLAYTIEQPPQCEPHPDGPPGG